MPVTVGIDPSGGGSRRVAVSSSWSGWKVVQSRGEARGRVVVSVPSEHLTFRNLTVPFSDRRRAADIVRQELANTLPMPLSDVAWSICPMGPHQVLAVISPRRKLDPLRSHLSGPNDVLDAEPFAYARALWASHIRDALVIDLGQTSSTFCLVRDKRPVHVRVMLRNLGDAKELAGFVDRLVDDAALPELPAELPVFLTGVHSERDDVQRALETRLGRPIKLFPVPGGLSPHTDVSALGAALRSMYPEDGVDLEGEQIQEKRRPWVPWAIAAVIMLGLLGADLKIRETTLAAQKNALSQQIRTAIQQEAPEASGLVQFQSIVLEARKAGGDTPDPLTLLDSLSSAADKRNIKLKDINVEEGHVNLAGDAPSFQELEAFRTALQQLYAEVEMPKSQTVRQHVRFELRVRLETP